MKKQEIQKFISKFRGAAFSGNKVSRNLNFNALLSTEEMSDYAVFVNFYGAIIGHDGHHDGYSGLLSESMFLDYIVDSDCFHGDTLTPTPYKSEAQAMSCISRSFNEAGAMLKTLAISGNDIAQKMILALELIHSPDIDNYGLRGALDTFVLEGVTLTPNFEVEDKQDADIQQALEPGM